MGVEAEIQGLDDVLAMLENLEAESIIKAARKGLQDGLQDIRSEAQMLCPVDTGQLRNSIKTRTKIKGGELVGEVYTAAEHARYVELGTGPRGEANHAGIDPEIAAKVTYSPKGWTYKDKNGEYRGTRGMPARPFLYPAFKSQKGNAYRKMARAVIRAARGEP